MDELKSTGLCPICRCEIVGLALFTTEQGPGPARQCARCATWYHQDCWEYGGGCGVYGCEPSAHPRPCPQPQRAPGPLWQRLVRAGTALSAGMAVFLFGAVLGLMGWCVAGPLALPVILLLGWCSDSRDRANAGSLTFRKGVLFGPLAFVVVPYPFVFLASIPLGLGLIALGQGLRFATARPLLAALCGLAVAGALSWSHAQESHPVPFTTLYAVPQWAYHNVDLGYGPQLIHGPEVAQAWRVGLHLDHNTRNGGRYATCKMCESLAPDIGMKHPIAPELVRALMASPLDPYGCQASPQIRPGRRMLVMPLGATEVEVVRIGDTLQVRTGSTALEDAWELFTLSPVHQRPRFRPNTEPVAIALPAGSEMVEVRKRSALVALLGPRLDELLIRGGSESRQVVRQTFATPEQLTRWLARE